MAEYIHLQGSEDVRRAGSAMEGAAETMRSAANQIDETLRQHRIFLDEWLLRFEQVLDAAAHRMSAP